MSWENIPASLSCGRDKMSPQNAIRVLLNNGTDERKKINCLAKILTK